MIEDEQYEPQHLMGAIIADEFLRWVLYINKRMAIYPDTLNPVKDCLTEVKFKILKAKLDAGFHVCVADENGQRVTLYAFHGHYMRSSLGEDSND